MTCGWLQCSDAELASLVARGVVTIEQQELEFPIVAIAGIGYLPFREAADDARMLYVGMTRATEHLLMTASKDSSFVSRLVELQQQAA